MRPVDADKLYPDCLTTKGTLAISQSQIANAPTVERPQGKWVEVEKQGKTGDGRIFTYTIIVCSECGEQFDLEGEKFCPHCGAEMQKL